MWALCMLCSLSCSNDLEVLRIVRKKTVSLSFQILSTGEFYSLDTDNAKIIIGAPEWRMTPDNPAEYKFYKRVMLFVSGQDGAKNISLSIALSVEDESQMIGSYRWLGAVSNPSSLPGKTILYAELILQQENAAPQAFKWDMCTSDQTIAELVVERQSATEKIVAGTFRVLLCNNDGSVSLNGDFKDIPY
jgi:hypothetical protein